jgi:hypothetical protein
MNKFVNMSQHFPPLPPLPLCFKGFHFMDDFVSG